MLVGTASDVGKSWIVAGICRWLKNNGYTPAPFKAQNMSLNSYVTADGKEIGRAQAVQAEACGIPCQVEMNPILLKPTGESKSQIVLNGEPIGDQTAKEYFLGNNKQHLFEEAKKSFFILQQKYSPVVLEGAGSISELNLKHRDIVNMRMAQAANACVYLVADIDKGGVFASLYGTVALLEDWEKALLKGIIINKFRGDASLFESGVHTIEELTGVPVIGVLPYAKDIVIEEEDSVALGQRNTQAVSEKVNVAIVHFHYLSNYTDFQSLEQHPAINVYYTRSVEQLQHADIILLPGTKNTLFDLQALHNDGLVAFIQEKYEDIPIIGICGGYQMMGRKVFDPNQVESTLGEVDGLGLFDMETTLTKEKTTLQQEFRFKDYPNKCTGYEIHMGETVSKHQNNLNQVGTIKEGYFDGHQSWGTYMHGIFDNQVVINELLQNTGDAIVDQDYSNFKETNFNKLADHMAQYLDMEKIMEDTKASIC